MQAFHTFHTALPSPSITIISEGDSVVGKNYTIICVVSTVEDIVQNIVLNGTWIGANGHPLQQHLTITNGTTASIALHFSSVDASHGGQYICNASITVPELSIVKTSSQRYNVNVQRKHKYQ